MSDVTQLSSEISKFKLTNPHAYMPPLEEISLHQPRNIDNPPHELVAFRTSSRAEKKSQEEKFFQQDFIRDYLDKKWNDESYNRDTFTRLYELLQQNPELKSQIGTKLVQFRVAIERQQNPYQVLRINFKEYPFEGKAEEEVDWND